MFYGKRYQKPAYGKRNYKKRKFMSKSKSTGGIMSTITHGTSALAKVAATTAGLVKSVQFIKSVINSEKKHVESKLWGEEGVALGQVYANSDLGWTLTDITPQISQGVESSRRTGDSVKLCSFRLRLQFLQQKNLQIRQKIRVLFIRVKGSPVDATTPTSVPNVMKRIFEPNPVTGLTDYFAVRNPDFYSEFQVIGSKSVYLGSENFSSINAPNQANCIMNVKMNHHVRWDQASEDLANGQYLLLMLADTGNNHPTTGSGIPNIANTQPLTGCLVTGFSQYYYYDN